MTASLDELLSHLRLTSDDVVAIKHNGFVAAEKRSRGVLYKLRWRFNRRQKVRYLGQASPRVTALITCLAVLREQRRLRRKLRAELREARAMMRAAHAALLPELEARGFRFHGRRVRKRRQPLATT